MRRRSVPELAWTALVCGGVCALVVASWEQAAPGPGGGTSSLRTCRTAMLVDGRLRCDDETPVDLRDVCGGLGPALRLEPGDRIDTSEACRPEGPSPDAVGRMEPSDLRRLRQPVRINTASVLELQSLPGIGPERARGIVRGRPYRDVEALVRVRGIGPKTLARLRSRVRVDPPGQAPERGSDASQRSSSSGALGTP